MSELLWIFAWWLQSFVLMAIAFPVAYRVFSFLPDRGLGFSRILGLLLTSYVIWLLGFVHYSLFSILLVWAGLAALGVWLWRAKAAEMRAFLSENAFLVLLYEGLFLCLFMFWAFVRMRHPEIVDQEKFMDFAFFNAFRHETRFPPFDPWLAGAGNYINYYYFGYFSMSSFARISGVDPNVAYNLVIALLYALTGTGIFALGYNLTRRLLPSFAGLVFLQVLGNLDGALQLLQNGFKGVDWWRPTRLIHDVVAQTANGPAYVNHWWNSAAPSVLAAHGVLPEAAKDAAISEFPYFTFLHGDMHPHLVAVPFALLALALALNLLKSPHREPVSFTRPSVDRLLPVLAMGLGLGALLMMNTWDLPAYGLTASLCLLAHQHRHGRLAFSPSPLLWAVLGMAAFSAAALALPALLASPDGGLTWLGPALKGLAALGWLGLLVWGTLDARFEGQHWFRGWLVPSAALLALAVAFALPFLATFKPPVGGVAFTGAKTGLRDALLFWGGFAAVLAPFLVAAPFALARGLMRRGPAAASKQPAKAAKSAARAARACPQCGAKLRDGKAICGKCGSKVEAAAPAPEPAEPEPTGDASQAPALVRGVLGVFAGPFAAPKGAAAWVLGAFGAVFVALLWLAPFSALLWLGLGLAALLLASRGEDSDGMFACVALMVGLAFILAVEWVHLKDTFADNPTLARMNTVFKFYFAAWILLAAAVPSAFDAAGRALGGLWGAKGRLAQWALAGLAVLAGLAYPVYATRGVWDTYDAWSNLPPTLDGSAWLRRDYPGDWAAIMRLRELPGTPVVAEAVGGEYTRFARVSSYSGLPCPVGWPGHEMQWGRPYPGGVQQDMDNLFATPDPALAQDIIRRNNITYVFCGALERQKFGDPALAKFRLFMDPVIEEQGTVVYRVRGAR